MNILIRLKEEEEQRMKRQQEVKAQPAEVRGNRLNDAHKLTQEEDKRKEQQKKDRQNHIDAQASHAQYDEVNISF